VTKTITQFFFLDQIPALFFLSSPALTPLRNMAMNYDITVTFRNEAQSPCCCTVFQIDEQPEDKESYLAWDVFPLYKRDGFSFDYNVEKTFTISSKCEIAVCYLDGARNPKRIVEENVPPGSIIKIIEGKSEVPEVQKLKSSSSQKITILNEFKYVNIELLKSKKRIIRKGCDKNSNLEITIEPKLCFGSGASSPFSPFFFKYVKRNHLY